MNRTKWLVGSIFSVLLLSGNGGCSHSSAPLNSGEGDTRGGLFGTVLDTKEQSLKGVVVTMVEGKYLGEDESQPSCTDVSKSTGKFRCMALTVSKDGRTQHFQSGQKYQLLFEKDGFKSFDTTVVYQPAQPFVTVHLVDQGDEGVGYTDRPPTVDTPLPEGSTEDTVNQPLP